MDGMEVGGGEAGTTSAEDVVESGAEMSVEDAKKKEAERKARKEEEARVRAEQKRERDERRSKRAGVCVHACIFHVYSVLDVNVYIHIS